MATYRKRTGPNGTRWQARVRRRGRSDYVRSFSTKKAATAWATDIENEIDKGGVPRSRDRTLHELLQRYTGSLLPNRRKKRQHQIDWWDEKLGGMVVAAITGAMIEDTLNELETATATRNRYLATLRHAYNYGIRKLEWTARNPCSGLAQREHNERIRFLDDDERGALLAACAADLRLHALVLLALSTAARQGELLSLRWNDVDLDRGRITITSSKTGGNRRVAFLSPSTVDIIKELPRRAASDLVLIGPVQNGSAKVSAFPRRAWLEAAATAEIKDFRFHDLRHTAASYLAMTGASLRELADALGHSTLVMVQRYSHLSDEHSEAVLRKMHDQRGL